MKKKIIIFGVGGLYHRTLVYINDFFDVIALSDNNSALHGTIIDSVKVISPSDLQFYDPDGIVILSSYSKEIYNQLIKIGIDESLLLNGKKLLSDVFKILLRKALITHDSIKKYEVAIYIDTLGNGGAEKALLELIKAIKKTDISICLIVTFNSGIYFNAMQNDIPVRSLFDLSNKELVDLAFILIEWSLLRQILNLSDHCIEISFLDGISSCLVVAGNADKKIGWIHSDLTYYLNDEQKKKDASILYSLFTDIVFVTHNAQASWECLFSEHTHVQKHVIYNIVNVGDITRHKLERQLAFDKITFVAVGRLDHVKGFDMLISLCHRLNNEGYDNYQLLIIGEGNDKFQLLKNQLPLSLHMFCL